MELNFNIENKEQVKDRLSRGYRARRNFLVSELFGMIVFATPVKTGRARGGWRITIGAPASAQSDVLDPDGLQTVSEQIANLRGAGAFQNVFISNTVPYIEDLEKGSSGQAPDGMVRVSLSAFKAQYVDVQ